MSTKRICCLGKGNLGRAFESFGIDTFHHRDKYDLNKYDIVINCVGLVGAKKCAEDFILAMELNVGWVNEIRHKKVIHFSTFYVNDENLYAYTKEMGEILIKNGAIIRIPWLFGEFVKYGFINDFINNDFKDAYLYKNDRGYLARDVEIVDFVLNNLDISGKISLANAGEVFREEVIEFINPEASIHYIERKHHSYQRVSPPTHTLKEWKDSLGDYLNGVRSMQPTA